MENKHVHFHVNAMYIKKINNLPSNLSIYPIFPPHERFYINNDELLGTIWEHYLKGDRFDL